MPAIIGGSCKMAPRTNSGWRIASVKHQERMRDALAAGWERGDTQRRKRLLYGALWTALEFQTWHTLARQQGFDDDESIELMVSMVRCLMHG
jgi:hypothetical protein